MSTPDVMSDFIEGVDAVPDQNIDDFTKNMYGEFLCKFLVDSNCRVLNGRQYKNDNDNGFNFVSTRGKSVVDYFIVPYEYIELYEGFKVRPTKIYGDNLNGVESRQIPDHSIVTIRFILNRLQNEFDPKLHHDFPEKRFTRYNVSDISPDFCSDGNLVQLLQALSDLEGQMQTQNDIDKIYDDCCTVVKNEMSTKLP